MIVTATALNYEQLPDVEAAIDNLAATARIQLRLVYGSQDSAFAAALPLGLVLPQAPEGPRRDPGGALMAPRDEDQEARRARAAPGARGWRGRGRGGRCTCRRRRSGAQRRCRRAGCGRSRPGTGSPMIGVPLGRNLLSGATLCADPISWFQRANLISNPSLFMLCKPGLGKSTVVRRMALGLTGYGVMPLVLGDLKPDYVDLIQALDGQVIRLGRGRGYLNILDPGEATAAAARLMGTARDEVIADARGRRHTMVATLITILRNAPPTDREETILDRAVHGAGRAPRRHPDPRRT